MKRKKNKNVEKVVLPKPENLEIERKFILKNVPSFGLKAKKFLIHQIYVTIKGVNTRFRMLESLDTHEKKYYKCVKTPISPGVFEEIEDEIDEAKFLEMYDKDHRYIIKTRYAYSENGLIWEIDKYHEMLFVTLEVELDDINQDIEIPECIKDYIIAEVTGQKEFSNYAISIKEGWDEE